MKKLTLAQLKVLKVLQDAGRPILSAEVGERAWPERGRFKNRQGAALAGGGMAGKLRRLGLVKSAPLHDGSKWRGWALTVDGRVALRKALEAAGG